MFGRVTILSRSSTNTAMQWSISLCGSGFRLGNRLRASSTSRQAMMRETKVL